MRRTLLRKVLLIAVLVNTIGFAAEPRHCLTRHLRAAVRNHRAKRMGKMPADQMMTLNVVLPLKDAAGLDSFLKTIYDPTSASYRHYMSAPQFTERF